MLLLWILFALGDALTPEQSAFFDELVERQMRCQVIYMMAEGLMQDRLDGLPPEPVDEHPRDPEVPAYIYEDGIAVQREVQIAVLPPLRERDSYAEEFAVEQVGPCVRAFNAWLLANDADPIPWPPSR